MRRPLPILVTLLLLSLTLFGADPKEFELPGPPAAGPGRIPHHHGAIESLSGISELSRENRSSAAMLLRKWLETRDGLLVLPPAGVSVGSRGTVRIEPAHRQLARFARSLPDEFLDLALERLAPIPIDGVHPWVWHPDQLPQANHALHEALERADRAAAWALLERPGVTVGIDPELLRWLDGQELPRGPWHRSDGPLTEEPEQTAGGSVEGALTIPLPRTGPERKRRINSRVQLTRRHPLSDLFPLIGDRMALLGNGDRVIAIDIDDPTLEAWQWSIHRPEIDHASKAPERPLPLISVPEIPVSSGDRCVFLLRTPRKYHRPSTNLIMESGPWKDKGWLEAVVLEIPDPTRPPVSSWVAPIAIEGFTACPTPLIEGDRMWLLATRGWAQLETWVFAFDLAAGKELWRRQVEVRDLEAHALNDLRDKILHASLVRDGDDLLVCRSGGAIDGLSATTGEHQAALYLPRWRFEELPSLSDIRWGHYRFLAYPGLRPRSMAPIQRPADDETPWLLLPPDGRLLIALDKESWQIRWSYPTSRQMSLLGIVDGVAWLVDLATPPGTRNVQLVGLDPRSGSIVAGPWTIPLETEDDSEGSAEYQRHAPLLRGQPRIFPGRIWFPAARGIEVVSLEDGTRIGLLPWPEGSRGGTPLPLPGGELLLARRADSALPSSSVIEVIRPAATDEIKKPEPQQPEPQKD